ncbi:MAG: hypothetical protein RJA19_702 [Bacteroidota bacterium]
MNRVIDPNQTPAPQKRNMRRRKGLWGVGLACMITLLSAGMLRENYFEIAKQLEIMNALFRELNIYYVDELQPGKIMESGIHAMLSDLDPYTNYYPESRVEDLRFMSTGEYGGIGATVEIFDDELTIVEVVPGFPAEKAGLKPGDIILEINGQKLKGLPMDLAVEKLQGATGSSCEVKLLRFGAQVPEMLTLVREKIELPAVPYAGIIGDNVGYVVLESFTRGCTGELRTAIQSLRDSTGISALVLDLRGNGGGLLQEAVSIVNLFVDKGKEVVATRGKVAEWNKSYATTGPALFGDLALVVLVDEQSASASEIVAGTLQDYDRALVVGRQSFGKGLVQQTKDLAYGTKVKVTVAKYYTPSGRCIQRLDYGGERVEGKAQAVPDSLIQTFYTTSGRPVRDGMGIEPDVVVPGKEYAALTEALMTSGILFRFANSLAAGQTWSPPAAEYQLPDADWSRFVAFCEGRSIPYGSQTEERWQAFLESAREEGFFAADSTAFLALSPLLKTDLRRDLALHKAQITELLEMESILRLRGFDGLMEWSLPRDPDVNEALRWLENDTWQKKLVGPGKPRARK